MLVFKVGMGYFIELADAPLSTSDDGREDILEFVRARLDFHPDAVQQQVLLCAGRSGILNCTRQWGKSSVSAAMMVYEAATKPGSLIIAVSKTHCQSMELVEKARTFTARLGERIRGDGIHRRSLAFDNGSRIIAIPSVESTARGYSAVNLLIIDEAAKVTDEAYYTMRPMLAVSKGRIWLLSTPYGKRGFFWREWERGGDVWARFSVKAEDCPRIDADTLAVEKHALGDERFEQEFCCKFVGAVGAMFDEELVDYAMADDAEDWLP